MSKVSNVLSMLEYLSTGKKYSINELAGMLEVSPRMIRVYKDELEKAGIFLDTIKGPYGGYVLNQKLNMPQRFVEPKKVVIKNKEIYNLLSKAIKERKKCQIEYFDKSLTKITRRIINPYNLQVLDSAWGVAAYCNLKNEIRHFYLERIKSIEVLEESF